MTKDIVQRWNTEQVDSKQDFTSSVNDLKNQLDLLRENGIEIQKDVEKIKIKNQASEKQLDSIMQMFKTNQYNILISKMRKDIEGFEPRLQAFEDNLAEHSNKLWDSQDQMKARLDICEKRVEAAT